ncbi:MAG: hypothetical protein JXR76_30335 [Deltaproteobacteria bacterium]|nr:hypothetical protein [Deltaproteobacteria bacterium]
MSKHFGPSDPETDELEYLSNFMRDISENRRNENQIRRLQDFLTNIVDALPSGIASVESVEGEGATFRIELPLDYTDWRDVQIRFQAPEPVTRFRKNRLWCIFFIHNYWCSDTVSPTEIHSNTNG